MTSSWPYIAVAFPDGATSFITSPRYNGESFLEFFAKFHMPFTSMLSFVKNNRLASGAIRERLGRVYEKRGKLSSGKCDGWLTANKICNLTHFAYVFLTNFIALSGCKMNCMFFCERM
jgi:hypothetical protein